MIGVEKAAALRAAYEKGLGPSAAGRSAGASKVTAMRYFRKFADAGIPKGKGAARRRSFSEPRPKYLGPDWIDKPIS